MLSNQFENIILEYKQDITAKKMGEPLIQRFMSDADNNPTILTPQTKKIVDAIQNIELGPLFNKPDPDKPAPTEEEKAKEAEKLAILKNQLAIKVLNKLEETDPTQNKEYVQWLARLYINGETNLEDVESTLADYLDKFHRLKTKHHLKNNDIGQYKDFDTFMNDMDLYPNDLIDDDQGKKKKYNADIIYDEKGILIVRPNDKEASCRYGRGTRWCTAATRGHNYFASYTSRGPLYMFMPRKPNHPGEKYQFHFEDGVVADETDSYLSQNQLIKLADDYPALKDAFKEQAEKFGLIWLQKPKRVHKGSNFNVEEYRKNDKPYYLMKPTDSDQIYGMENTDDGGMKVFDLSNSGSYSSGELNAIEEHDLFNNYPELVSKFKVKGANIISDPVVTDTKSNAKIEQHGNMIIMTDQHGHKTAIRSPQPHDSSLARYGSGVEPLQLEAIRTSPFVAGEEDTQRGRANIPKYHTLNPYELTLEHPELVDVFGPTVQKLAKQINKNVKDQGADAKQLKELMEKSLRGIAAYLPYKLYDKGNIVIKSHMTSDGKPVRDYIVNKKDNTATLINRDLTTGEVDSIQPANVERLSRISKNDSHTLHNTQGELYGDAQTQSEYQRLYSSPNDRGSDEEALDFLPSISFLEQNPELKEFYKDTSLLEPKVKEFPTSTVRDYGKVKVPDGKSNRGYHNSIINNVKSMRNYIVSPKDADDGESYAISWSPEEPKYVEVYHSADGGQQTRLETAEEIQHVLKMFPEIRKLHVKDYKSYVDRDPERMPEKYSQYSNNDVKRNGMAEYMFNPSEEVENDRVKIEQFGPNEDQTHELPKFEVKPKQDNPFGKVGDTYAISFSLKDQRGKFGKISDIYITRYPKNLHKNEPIDRYGNYENIENRQRTADGQPVERDKFVPVDKKLKYQKEKLGAKEISDFFKYYPELRRMIRDENIHPKTPPPALAAKPDEEGNVDSDDIQMGNFTLENAVSTSPGVEKQYILPNEEEYPGEFYTLFTYDPHSEPAFKNGQTSFTEYGNMKTYNDRGFTQLVKGELEKSRGYYNRSDTTQDEMNQAFQGRDVGTVTPNTPGYNEIMKRFPDLEKLISEKSIEIGDHRTQNLSEDDVSEIGTERVYTFKNKDGSDLYIITPVGNALRGQHGEIKQTHSENSGSRLGSDVGNNVRRITSDEQDWEAGEETWNNNAYAINFESTENNPYLIISLLQDPFAGIIDLQLMDTNLGDTELKSVKNNFSVISIDTSLDGGIETAIQGTYLGKAKKNPELYRWLKDKAEQRNKETAGIGDFINFLDVTSEQMTDEQRSVPKAFGVDIVGIAKIGISNPIYMWQGRHQAFERVEYHLDTEEKDRYGGGRNITYKNSLKDLGVDVGKDFDWRKLVDSTILIKPESDTKFMTAGNRGYGNSGNGKFVQVPNAKFLNMAKHLPNSDKIIPKKNLKAMGAIPTQTWGPRQVAALAPNSKVTNNGKPWIKSIQEFKMPDGLGIESHGYGADLPSKVLPPGTGYLITLNPISDDEGPKKRVDGKLVRQLSPHTLMYRAMRHQKLDLPWEFTHEILDNGKKENKLLIYFANNRVAYLINPMSNSFTKYNLKQEEKKALFFDEEYGLFPQLKPIFDQFSKSNKWLREHEFHAIMSKVLFEGLGDKAYYELQKKKSKPNYGQLVFLKNIRLAGSYDNNKLKELGFFMKNGDWAISKPKYDRLVGDGELREMDIVNRPLKTGTNKIPKVGKKKVTEEPLEEGKKFPRTSEFLQVKELAEIKRLAGVYEPYQTEGDESMGSNISKTASQISKIMKEKNIQPGTPEWFQLWFSKPYLTGEKPTGD
mgnify:FL=1|jgi:hypothetical protein